VRRAALVIAIVGLLGMSVSPAGATEWLIPPVDGPIAARFDAPDSRWGPGHRGIDYVVPAGTAVRAAGSGTVTFAGPVAATVAVTIDHGGGMETTYTDLADVLVVAGQAIAQGHVIGTSAEAHAGGTEGVHLGVILNGRYVDPELYVGPLDISAAIHLAPHVWMPPDILPTAFRTPFLSANAIEPCADAVSIAPLPVPPSDNVAVLVAGIGSKTRGGTSAALYEGGPELLGYPRAKTYRFSYRSSAAPDLHVDYDRSDTFGDLRAKGNRLRTLLREVARRHPGQAVDLIAHSQGGIVARSYLQLAAESWDARLPHVEHLVTFATPHNGAPLAGAIAPLERSPSGRAALTIASRWAQGRGPIPDPYAPAVAQMAPGSGLLRALDREAVLYGTRVLSLGIANDVVVPADHARWDGHPATVIGPRGLNGHDAIVTSPEARGIAHAFLRDARTTCRGGWDLWGPRIGAGISLAERILPRFLP
jgi:hypothetical protein